MGEPPEGGPPFLRKEGHEPGPGAAPAPAGGLPAVLRGDDPQALLAGLLDGDPLGLRGRCARRARAEAVLLPPERLVLRAMARIAVEAAIDELLEEQRDEERRGAPLGDAADADFYARLARVLGVELADARRACSALNGLPDAAREAFHGVVLEGCAPEDWAEQRGLAGERVAELLRAAGRRVDAAVRAGRAPRRGRRG